jgi:GWxTD domain-containing protein
MFNKLILYPFLFCPLAVQAIPDVSLQINRFHSDSSPYIELSVYIVGTSLQCKPAFDYGVNYTVTLKDKKENIIDAHRFKLINTGCPAKDLIDVRRFNLSPGEYIVDVEINDLMDSLNVISIQQPTTIEVGDAKSGLSDIQLLSTIRTDIEGTSTLHKSGLYLEPLPFRYYYPALDFINLYIETYQTDQVEGQPYLRYTIKPSTGSIPAPIVAYRKVRKEKISANVFQLDIKNLISGPYIIEAALFDGNKNQLASKQIDFSRYNPAGDSIYMAGSELDLSSSFASQIPADSIDYFLKALAPVVNSAEVDIMNTLLQKGTVQAKQFFIHRYWTQQAGKFAAQAFNAYMKVARVVDENYRSGFGYGFETDRGHIFLKYGKPDDVIEVEDEPSAPPYEIWFYTTFPATHQNNVRFLFYNPSLSRNGFKLLHSTAIGEVKNEKWEVELYRDATLETPGVNEKQMGDNVYRNARKYFEN